MSKYTLEVRKFKNSQFYGSMNLAPSDMHEEPKQTALALCFLRFFNRGHVPFVRICGKKDELPEHISSFYWALEHSGAMTDYSQCVFLYDGKVRFEAGSIVSDLLEANSRIKTMTFDQLPDQQSLPAAIVYIPENVKDFTKEYRAVFRKVSKLLVIASSNPIIIENNSIPTASSLFTNLQTDIHLW